MKVNIIGAGMSGLSVGCYLQMNGFETEIFEKNLTAGGLCTSWKREGYTVNGSLHWLLGSTSSNPFHKLWSELINMDEVEFVNHDIRLEVEVKNSCDQHGGKVFRFYTNLDKLESYLLDISPADQKPIRSLIRSMRKYQQFDLPPAVDSVIKFLPLRRKIGMIKYFPFLFEYLRWRNVTNYSFARKLSSPFLREAFKLLFDGDEVKIMILTVPSAYFDKKSAGYPIGGSYRFIQRIEERYLSLGGKIHYESMVEEILTEKDRATGIRLKDGKEFFSEFTISAADWYYTVFKVLGGKFTNQKLIALKNLEKLEVYPSIFNVTMGIADTLADWPHFFRFPLSEPMHSPDGTDYERFEIHIYNYDPTIAPPGKTVLTASFYTKKGDFWINAQENDRKLYDQAKTDFSNRIIAELEKKMPVIRDKIEMVDILSPATLYRYTNTWKGSAQGWFPGKNLAAASPVGYELPGLKNFYYSSQWSVPGGGLPVCVKTARDLVQTLCHDKGMKFRIIRP
jgi:phytoene dehydrogenase-like protein